MAFNKLEPFGEERADLRTGMVASLLVNINSKRGSRKSKPSDWIMRFVEEHPQSPEEMKLVLRGLAKAMSNADKQTKQMSKRMKKKRGRKGK